jgi:hypothetical protein
MTEEIKLKRNLVVVKEWPRLMDLPTAAAYIAMSPKTLRNRLSRKAEDPFEVKPKRRGRKVLFDRLDLDKYADSL